MKRLILASAVAGGLLLFGSEEVLGHGGGYRGPGDVVPPSEGGGPGTGGPNTGGPTTPGPSGPTTPGGGRGPTTPGGGQPGPGGGSGAPRGPTTGGMGGKKNAGVEGFEQWQFWWEYNKDRYLNLRDRLAKSGNVTGNAGFLTGYGRKSDATASARPTDAEIHGQIVPVLRSVLNEDDADILDSAVLALGRVLRADAASLVIEDFKSTLKNPNNSVRESTILAMGVLGSREFIPLLVEIMNDTSEGRSLLGLRNPIQNLERAFAAISLGYIGAPESIPVLMEVIDKNDNSQVDLRSSAILALAMFDEGKEEVVKYLADLLRDDKLDRTTRAQIPVALGRIGEVAYPVHTELIKLLKGRKTDIRLQESAVIGLGLICGPTDGKVIDTLIETIEESNNEQARHFSYIALAQIAAKAAQDLDQHRAVLDQVVEKFLLKDLTKPKRATHQPWAGLAVALIGRELPVGDSLRNTIISKLMETFEDSNNPSYKSAFAVGLGLMEAGGSAAEAIYEEMQDTRDLKLKGYLALSLGMQSYVEASETLNSLVLDNRDPNLRLQVATALGLMGDKQALGTLLEALKTAETLNVIASLAKAIGLIGDRTAIPQLAELIQDQRAPGLARAFGCVALGLVGEKTSLPWNTRMTENANYRTVLPSLYEIADIL